MRINNFLFALALTALSVATFGQPRKTLLPVKYDEDRFYLSATAESGENVLFFTDTGGGLFIYKHVAERLRLIPAGDTEQIELPKFPGGVSIPEPLGTGGKIFVFEKPEKGPPLQFDVLLGQQWFADRIWTFDYPARQLVLWDKTPKVVGHGSRNHVRLGFKTDEAGKRVTHFPRIQAVIDGEMLDMLFDTGATTFLTPEALAAIGDGRPSARATSFITASTFEKWRQRHPDWRVIENAEIGTGQSMIEARDVRIAGHKVDRAWFTRRPDKNFHEFMSGFMDKRVEGAIGGTVFRNFRITVDYPQAIAVFERK